jgi:Mycothiol maleylpyruvate isomerase N-terminal domain
VTRTSATDPVRRAYDALTALVGETTEPESWSPTGCRGWAVRDLTFHLLGDAQRALVALHTPVAATPDRDAVTYWQDWGPDEQSAANGRRHVRVAASMFLVWDQLRDLYLETAHAVLHAADHATPSATVRTQGHVLGVADLLSTLCVEATIHHLDLTAHLPGAPAPSVVGLGEVRRVLDGLLGEPAGSGWSDERYARVATGRAQPDEEETRDLGALLDRLPALC